jgi:hypothetical protein
MDRKDSDDVQSRHQDERRKDRLKPLTGKFPGVSSSGPQSDPVLPRRMTGPKLEALDKAYPAAIRTEVRVSNRNKIDEGFSAALTLLSRWIQDVQDAT